MEKAKPSLKLNGRLIALSAPCEQATSTGTGTAGDGSHRPQTPMDSVIGVPSRRRRHTRAFSRLAVAGSTATPTGRCVPLMRTRCHRKWVCARQPALNDHKMHFVISTRHRLSTVSARARVEARFATQFSRFISVPESRMWGWCCLRLSTGEERANDLRR